jgi:alpha 1,6-mannosyltransferase
MIQRQTAVALEWLAERPLEIARLHAEGDDDAVRKLSEANMASEPKDGGPLGVMEWTGPGLWTDCVLR